DWYSGGSFPVRGDKCWVPTGRSVPEKQRDPCDESEPGNSSISPRTGNVSFSVPITSWGYRGSEIGFALTYHWLSITDPALAFQQLRHPAALSDDHLSDNYNPLWTHSFAQWIEVLADGTAVWNRGDGKQVPFAQYWQGNQGPYWRAEDS